MKVLAVPVPTAIVAVQHTCEFCRALLEIRSDDCSLQNLSPPMFEPQWRLVTTCGNCHLGLHLPRDAFRAGHIVEPKP